MPARQRRRRRQDSAAPIRHASWSRNKAGQRRAESAGEAVTSLSYTRSIGNERRIRQSHSRAWGFPAVVRRRKPRKIFLMGINHRQQKKRGVFLITDPAERDG